MVQERRRWRRVNCLPASLRSAQAGDAVEQGVLLRLETQDPAAAVLNTYACDMSLGGLAFEVKKNIALPDPLSLKVFLPHAHTPLDCSSRIAWQKLNEQTAHIGVAFPQLSEEQHDTLKDFLREIGGTTVTVEREPAPLETRVLTGPAEVQETEPPPPQRGSRRDQAIWQFEQGVLLYHQRQLFQAKREFQKAIKEYGDVIDVARVARRYHDWCNEEKEERHHG